MAPDEDSQPVELVGLELERVPSARRVSSEPPVSASRVASASPSGGGEVSLVKGLKPLPMIYLRAF